MAKADMIIVGLQALRRVRDGERDQLAATSVQKTLSGLNKRSGRGEGRGVDDEVLFRGSPPFEVELLREIASLVSGRLGSGQNGGNPTVYITCRVASRNLAGGHGLVAPGVCEDCLRVYCKRGAGVTVKVGFRRTPISSL